MSKPNTAGLSGAYRAVWRWHFYAGLMVLPVLMLMALTGGLYLFKAEIEGALYGGLSAVEARGETVSPDRWTAAAEVGLGGTATSVFVPDRPDRAVQVKVRTDAGDRTAFVDPYDARVIGSVTGDGVMGSVKRLHSLEILGRPFNILIEIVAGWAIILVATGLYLWWPRGRDVATAKPRAGDPRRRPFWRDLHAVTGLYAGAVIAFLAVTGMPWSAVWGDVFLTQMRESGLGRPPAPAANPWSHAGHDAPAGQGWTMEGVGLRADGQGAPSLDRVVATAEAEAMPRPYTVSIPGDPGRAWTVAPVTTRAEDARSLYVDGRTGAVIGDARWAQFGAGAQAFEWGIAVHQGTQYGWTNRIVMLLGCIAIWMLAISGGVMWWKRRAGRPGLGAPTAPPGPRVRAAVLGIVLPLAILYPLTGLSLLAAIGVDRLVRLIHRPRPEVAP
ncbi:PepSY-associated TM helix domain-containing protein [Brevundimonas lutea]|uniref:PepSY-associated TM helix domain-containing protein n=1 Tax=Brevundimonas lutea TaxID=2293980 RepID=UPI000F03FA22|nr:PepSY domain-containing protein [Brevundimonas lutea]